MTFRAREVEAWNDTASLPLLPSDESVEVFTQLRKSPALTWTMAPAGGPGRCKGI